MGKNNRGFTLTELLIVIVLVGITSSFVIYTNVQTSLKKSRDATRKTNVEQIRAALEMYREDKGSYPPGGSTLLDFIVACDSYNGPLGSCSGPCGSPNVCRCNWGAPWICDGVTYMGQLPDSPLIVGGVDIEGYHYRRTASGYLLGACLENSADTGPNTGPAGSGTLFVNGCTSNRIYTVANP